MPASSFPITIWPGERFDLPLTWETGSPPAAVDVTGWTAVARFYGWSGVQLVVASASPSPDPAATGGPVDSADGTIVLTAPPDPQTVPPTPNVELQLSGHGTAKIRSSGRWELWLTPPGGAISTDPSDPSDPSAGGVGSGEAPIFFGLMERQDRMQVS